MSVLVTQRVCVCVSLCACVRARVCMRRCLMDCRGLSEPKDEECYSFCRGRLKYVDKLNSYFSNSSHGIR